MKHINITNADIVKNMSDDAKHNLARHCINNGMAPEEFINNIRKVTVNVVNCAIDLCNDFFKTPAGKEYLNMRERIDRMGEK